jgi:transposase
MEQRFQDLKTKKDRVAFVKTKLETDSRWLLRGLVAIYRRQTSAEQQTRSTKNVNSVGFSAFDAEFMSAMAERVLKDLCLSPRQIEAIRKTMKKYAGQLVRISTGAA